MKKVIRRIIQYFDHSRWKKYHWYGVDLSYRNKQGQMVSMRYDQIGLSSKSEVSSYRKIKKMLGPELIRNTLPYNLCNGELYLGALDYLGYYSKHEEDEPVRFPLMRLAWTFIVPVCVIILVGEISYARGQQSALKASNQALAEVIVEQTIEFAKELQ